MGGWVYDGHLPVRKMVSDVWRRWDFFAFGSQRNVVISWLSTLFNAVLRV